MAHGSWPKHRWDVQMWSVAVAMLGRVHDSLPDVGYSCVPNQKYIVKQASSISKLFEKAIVFRLRRFKWVRRLRFFRSM